MRKTTITAGRDHVDGRAMRAVLLSIAVVVVLSGFTFSCGDEPDAGQEVAEDEPGGPDTGDRSGSGGGSPGRGSSTGDGSDGGGSDDGGGSGDGPVVSGDVVPPTADPGQVPDNSGPGPSEAPAVDEWWDLYAQGRYDDLEAALTDFGTPTERDEPVVTTFEALVAVGRGETLDAARVQAAIETIGPSDVDATENAATAVLVAAEAQQLLDPTTLDAVVDPAVLGRLVDLGVVADVGGVVIDPGGELAPRTGN